VVNESPVDRILFALQDVKDPEIPVVSVVELGIVRSVEVEGGVVNVSITPTFLGCPALETMRREIAERIAELGYTEVTVQVVRQPAWSSDLIAPAARERMKSIGLAPPAAVAFRADPELGLAPAGGPSATAPVGVACPYCGATDTVLESSFGPTICRALHYCNACRQSFEEFKAL
jgi:ring-1,2-phenylacetyl-CoA epoxidase subunit PaaD